MTGPQQPVSKTIQVNRGSRMLDMLSRYARLAVVNDWHVLVLATHWPHLELSDPQTIENYQVDKFLHLFAFATLAVLLIYGL